MGADLMSQERRLARVEAVLVGTGLDESGGLRAQISALSLKMDKDIMAVTIKMDQMTFWFRLGAFALVIFLALFGPPQIQEVIRLLKGRVP